MRRIYLIIVLGIVLITGIIVGVYSLEQKKGRTQQMNAQQASSSTAGDRTTLSPSISLQINNGQELSVYQGTPLILSVRIANREAMDAEAHNESNQALIEELQEAVNQGEIPKNEAEDEISQLRQRREVRVIKLGYESDGWVRYVRFEEIMPDGKRRPITWSLKLLGTAQEKTIVLDDSTTPQLDYALEPVSAEKIPTGEYSIIAALDVPFDAKLPADRWRGRVESQSIKLRVTEKPVSLTPQEEGKYHIALARYAVKIEDADSALDHAQKALALNPRALAALILIGEAKEKRGDFSGAMTAFQDALKEYKKQHPGADIPHSLFYRINVLSEKIEKSR